MIWNGFEKRRFPRAKFPCKILIFLPQEHTLITHTENIGCGGVRVIIEGGLKLFSIVGLEIFITPDQPIKCKGKIVWQLKTANPLTNDILLFDVGLEFIDIKDSDKKKINTLVENLLKKEEC